MIDSKGYRPNVGIILCNSEGQVFWAKRMGVEAWQFPQGGINDDEDPETAMYRELWEETGLDRQHVQLLGRTRYWLRYQLPERYLRKNSLPLCVGQKQIWYMLRLLTTDSYVRFDHCSKPEFDNWRWVDYWEPLKDVVYFKRKVYQKAMAELATILSTDKTLANAIDFLPKEPCFNMADANGYSPNVGIILCNNEGRIFLAKLADSKDWQFPEGIINDDEDPETVMFRELRKKIGLKQQDVQILGRTRYWLRYRLPERYQHNNLLPLCSGQKQIWYMLRLLSSDSSIHFDHWIKPEFDNWQWIDYWESLKNVVYYKRKVYKKALTELDSFINR